MFLAYTASVTVGTGDGMVVRRVGSGTEGEAGIDIPKEVSVRAISVVPEKSGGSFPAYHIKGMHSSSAWAKIDSDVGEFEIDGITDNVSSFFRIKADSGTVTFSIFVKGQ